MATLYIGKDHAYRDEISLARAESAHAAVHAARANTLDWSARLLFRLTWDCEDHFTTDTIEARHWLVDHPEAAVRVMTVN